MKQVGYSTKPLFDKLGFTSTETVLALNAPDWFAAELQKAKLTLVTTLPATWVHAFFTQQIELEKFLAMTNLQQIQKGLWVSWPKKASHLPTDLTEQTFRDVILPLDWVDIKIVAIDQTWSGLKFTRRKN